MARPAQSVYAPCMTDQTQDAGSDERAEVAQFTASSCQLVASAWVVQLVVGDVQGERGATKVKEVPRISVAFPWPLAKVVHRILGAAIERYEEQEGAIAVPRSVHEQIEKQLGGEKTSG